jgi:hypothetical protein
MSIEEELRNLGSALDRAIEAAAADTSRAPLLEPIGSAWSRRRAAAVTLLAAAAIAVIVGVIVHLDRGDPHGIVTTGSTGTSVASSPVAPSTTGASTPTTAATTTAPGVALQSVDWAAVVYPMHPGCGPGFTPPTSVGRVAYATPAPDAQVAVVLVRCTVGAGTPPVSLFVYDGATSTHSPHLAATLVADADEWQASDFTVDGAALHLPVSGFSSTSVANCCPDVHATLQWRWSASGYQLASVVPAHLTFQQYNGAP